MFSRLEQAQEEVLAEPSPEADAGEARHDLQLLFSGGLPCLENC